MKKKLLLAAVAAAVLSSSISVCAAPQYMSDGAVFDPEWYLEQNPDVAGWALGTSADALYQHFVQHGASEGRVPYNAAAFDPNNVLPYQGESADSSAAAQPEASQEQQDDTENIFAVEGETYRFPSIHSDRFGHEECTVTLTFSKGDISEDPSNFFSDYLAAYTLPGYEWRKFDVSASSSMGSYHNIATPGDFLKGRVYYYEDDIITNIDSIWEALDENGWVTHAATYTVSQNGTEYPDCKLFETWNLSNAGEASFSWYALVPNGFSGGIYGGYVGVTLENGKAVVNESSPYIFFGF